MVSLVLLFVVVASCALSFELQMGFRSGAANILKRVIGRGGGKSTIPRTDDELKSGIAK
jgi:hypothetical protein